MWDVQKLNAGSISRNNVKSQKRKQLNYRIHPRYLTFDFSRKQLSSEYCLVGRQRKRMITPILNKKWNYSVWLIRMHIRHGEMSKHMEYIVYLPSIDINYYRNYNSLDLARGNIQTVFQCRCWHWCTQFLCSNDWNVSCSSVNVTQ